MRSGASDSDAASATQPPHPLPPWAWPFLFSYERFQLVVRRGKWRSARAHSRAEPVDDLCAAAGSGPTWLAAAARPCHRRVVLSDPSLRIAQWLMLFGAVVWVFMFATGVMGAADFAVHELFSLLAFVVLRRLQRGQRTES